MFGKAIDKYASPENAYALSSRLTPWFGWVTLVLLLAGLWGSLVYAPPDYEQGESFRIIYLHVPAAWMSMFIYVVMAAAGAVGLVWKIKVFTDYALHKYYRSKADEWLEQRRRSGTPTTVE